MKRISILYLVTLLLVHLLESCSSSSEEVKQTIFFSVNNVNITAATGQSGKGFTFAEGDTLGLFLTGPSTENASLTTPLLQNNYCAYSSDGWKLEQSLSFYEEERGEAMTLYAYYPYNSKYTSKSIRFEVQSDQSTQEGLKASDFMCASQACTVGTNPSLQLIHKMARIVVNITYASEEIKHCNEIRLSVHPKCSINLETDKVSTESSYAVLKGYESPAAANSLTQQLTFILPPQYLSTNYPIEFIYDEILMKAGINQQFEGGTQYTLHFTSYGEASITYEGMTVSPWNQVEVSQGSLDMNNEIEVPYETGSVIVYQKSEKTNPATLVITGDGYTVNELNQGGKFETDCKAAYDRLFSTEPYKTYQEYFNAYAIAAVSNQSGSSNTTTGVNHDTYFQVAWGDGYSDMNVGDSLQLYNFIRKYCPDLVNGTTTLNNTTICVLVNDPDRYAGITMINNKSGKNYSILSTKEGVLSWNSTDPENAYYSGDWTNVFIHEFGGHAFGRLGDEYYYSAYKIYPYNSISYHSWTVPYCLNLTTDNKNAKGTVYWKHLLDNSDYPRVGFYEGGMYYQTGVWRSEVISCMCDNRPYFNAISRQLIVEHIMQLSGETFSLEDFYSKDVKTDPVRDSNKSAVQTLTSGVTIYPPLPSPKFQNE